MHVWRADLDRLGDELVQFLCAEERARGERFMRERERERWVCARGMLRMLLGRYLEADPSALRLTVGAHGKPQLLEERPLSFNLSHSRGLALYAFTTGPPVGIDVEVARRSIDEVALAARVFGRAQAQRLAGLDPPNREREFLRLWTRHEAELKLRGAGLGRGHTTVEREAWIGELQIGSRGAGAVAIEEPPLELCCWELPRGSSRRSFD